MEWIYSLEEMDGVARAWWKEVGSYRVFGFHGEMGVGKTSLIHALCKCRGVRGSLSSPTYSLINEYELMGENGPILLYHMDLYRVSGREEAIGAGVEEILHSGAYCFVEWPERATGIFPDNMVQVYLDWHGADSRKLVMRFPGETVI